jgi:hypothetical protein
MTEDLTFLRMLAGLTKFELPSIKLQFCMLAIYLIERILGGSNPVAAMCTLHESMGAAMCREGKAREWLQHLDDTSENLKTLKGWS